MSAAPFGVRVVEAPNLPDDTILVVVSPCSCRHAIGDHNEHGCDAVGMNCDCDVPVSRLIVKIQTRTEEPS